jgi:hypothetical protein
VNRLATRGLVIAGWLLTPVVAWAVSFLGGWLGALAGSGAGSDTGALGALGVGAVVGAVVGATGWVLAIRSVTKYFVSQSKPRSSP